MHSLSATSDYPKVEELHTKVKELCQKLEDVEHLSWLGLFKDTKAYTFGGTGAFLSNCNDKHEKKEKYSHVFERFKKYA